MEIIYRHIAIIAYFCFLITILHGCATSRSLSQPSTKDMEVLQVGTDRDLVRAEFGAPLPSSRGDNCDVFAFEEGSTGWKYARAMGYSVLAVGTLGLSEIISNPIEESVGNDKIRLRVCYDNQQKVERVETLEVGKPAKDQNTAKTMKNSESFGAGPEE